MSSVSLLKSRRALTLAIPQPRYKWVLPNVAEIYLSEAAADAFAIHGVQVVYGAIRPIKQKIDASPTEAFTCFKPAGPRGNRFNYDSGADAVLIELTIRWNVLKVLVISRRNPSIRYWISLPIK